MRQQKALGKNGIMHYAPWAGEGMRGFLEDDIFKFLGIICEFRGSAKSFNRI